MFNSFNDCLILYYYSITSSTSSSCLLKLITMIFNDLITGLFKINLIVEVSLYIYFGLLIIWIQSVLLVKQLCPVFNTTIILPFCDLQENCKHVVYTVETGVKKKRPLWESHLQRKIDKMPTFSPGTNRVRTSYPRTRQGGIYVFTA